jgi:4-carboxymuconolactone decarboxylase
MKFIAAMIASLSLLSTLWAQGDHATDGRKSKPMPTLNDSRMVAPALEKYAQGPLAELWKRPGLTPRDRSIVNVAALIAQIPYHLNRAMDNGLTQAQAAEVITHLAFYVGWPNAFSALPVAKEVFEKRPH